MKDARGIGQATKLQSIRNLEHGEIDQQVCDLEITVHRPSAWNETERDGNGAPAPPSSFIRWGALGAMLAGLAWLVSGFVAFATVVGEGPEVLGFVPLDEALNGVALVGTLVGLVSLHTWQAPSYGRLGSVGFLTSFLGVSLLLVGLVLSFLSGRILEQMLGLGFLGILFGFVLLGAATLRLGLLPWWCALLLIACPFLAINLGDYGGLGFLGILFGFVLLGAATLRLGLLPRWCALLLIACPFLAINLGDYGAALALGLIWLVLGGTLLLQGDLSAFFQTSEKSEQTAETTYSRQLGE